MLKLRKFHTPNEPNDAPKKCRLSTEERAERKAVRKEQRRRIYKKIILPALALCLLTAFLFGILVMVVSASMVTTGQKKVLSVTDVAVLNKEKAFDCILVLGAGLRPDGSPSDMLYDRVAVGVELHRALEGVPLLMSGDRTGDYDEVTAMKKLAVDLGVDEALILLDPQGFSTYESILRAKEVYGIKRMLVVTQEYHLYRAMYLSEALEVEVYGVSADLRTYSGQGKREVREVLARFKDLFQGAKLNHADFDEASKPGT